MGKSNENGSQTLQGRKRAPVRGEGVAAPAKCALGAESYSKEEEKKQEEDEVMTKKAGGKE